MIRRVIKVHNVGRLRRLAWGKGVGDAGKLVGVYAENGSGKSTFVATLRAAREGLAGPVLERRSLPDVGQPSIELLTTAGRVDFVGGAWTATLPAVEVFDRAFVSQNVYDGREVGPDQREGLYRLALGAGEVAAAIAVNEAKTKKKAADDEYKAVRSRVDERCGEVGTTADAIGRVASLSVAPPELPEMETRLAALGARSDLSGLPDFATMPKVPAINVEGLRALLSETAVSISAEAAAAVRSHISRHLDGDGERWLRQGVAYAKERRDCPYCGQALEGSAFAELFPAFFDESYRRLQEKIAKAIGRVAAWEAWSVAVSHAQGANQRAWSAWSQLDSLPEPPDAVALASSATEVVTLLRELMLDKQAHLLDAMGADDRVTRIEAAAGAMHAPIAAYQSWLSSAIKVTRRLRSDHAGAMGRLRVEVGRIRTAVLAGSPSMIAELAKLDAATKAAAGCKTELEHAQRELEVREASRTSAFVVRINAALDAFGAGFRLQDLKGKSSAKRVVADFKIILAEGGRVLDRASVAASLSKGAGPRFDTVLSEGDRTTLALAVFFAKCTSAPNADRVAVLDDPFTSLDSGRRATTIQHLRELAGSCAQVWVLSHDEFFLRDSLPRSATWLTLIEENGTIGFSPWDSEGACRTTYARNVSRLEDFIAHGPGALRPDDAWQKLRPVLESYLRFRFPKVWQQNEWLGDFVRKGRARDPSVPLSLADVERIATWCGFSNPGMHGDPFDAGPPPTEAEVRNIVQAVVAFVQS